MAQTVFKRYETKYFLTKEQEVEFLKRIEGRMVMDQYGEHNICNIYFDTEDFDLARLSIAKPVYKEKLRLRSYGVPEGPRSKVFVEIKKKYDGIVYKRREELTLLEAENYLYKGEHPDKDTQIMREIDWFLKTNKVLPQVYLAYDRRAFYEVENPDFRLTLDRNIRARRKQLNLAEGSVGEAILPDNITLMEIKIPGIMPLWMAQILSDMKIYPASFSKYGYYYMKNRELFMSAVNNHRQYFDTNSDLVHISAIRVKKAQKIKKTGR